MVHTPPGSSYQRNRLGEGRLLFRIPSRRTDGNRLLADQAGRCQRDHRVEPKERRRRATDAPVIPLAWRFEPARRPRLFKGWFKLPTSDEPRQDLYGVES